MLLLEYREEYNERSGEREKMRSEKDITIR
jgi:hypothetical protein